MNWGFRLLLIICLIIFYFTAFSSIFYQHQDKLKKGNNYDNNKPIGLAYIIISTSSGYKNILMNIEFYLSFHLFNPLFFFYLLAKKYITCQTNKQPLPLCASIAYLSTRTKAAVFIHRTHFIMFQVYNTFFLIQI